MGKRIIIIDEGRYGLEDQIKLFLGENNISTFDSCDCFLQNKKTRHSRYIIFIGLDHSQTKCKGHIELLKQCIGSSIIMASPKISKRLLISAIRLGVDDYLQYPFSKVELLDALNRVTQNKFNSHYSIHHFRKRFSQARDVYKIFYNMIIGRRKVEFNDPTLTMNLKDKSQDLKCVPHNDSSDDAKYKLIVQFFGQSKIEFNGKLLNKWTGKKSKQLFLYFILKKKPIYPDVLMEKFWPDQSPDSARNCLNVTIHQIRRTFNNYIENEKIVLFKKECYLINPKIKIESDVEKFCTQWRQGFEYEEMKDVSNALKAYNAAATLYRGDFLEDYIYDEWTDLERENLKETYLLILNKISHYYSLNGKPGAAIDICQQILNSDQCREDVHRRLMRCYYRVGKKDQAIKQFYRCEIILREQLDVQPSKLTVDLLKKIKNL